MNKKFFLLLLLPLFFLPQIASTRLGKPFFTKAIKGKTGAEVEIGTLSLSWFGPQRFQDLRFQKDSIQGSVEELSIQAPFWSFSGPFQLKNGTVNKKVTQINGQMEGDKFELAGEIEEGELLLKGTAHSKEELDIAVQVKNLPLQFWGNIDLVTKVRASHGEIILLEPLLASLNLPSQGTVRLRIEPSGFLFPLPYSLSKVKVEEAVLDLGQLRFKKGEMLAPLTALFKANQLLGGKEINGWFTPVDCRLENGLLAIGRIDFLLANTIHLCSWGKIDLVKERVDMILGIPAETLDQFFAIRNLSKNYVLKVEVRGTLQQPELVTAPATAKIAALIAAGQISKKSPFGRIAELFSNPKDEKEVPPPKRPFPWER